MTPGVAGILRDLRDRLAGLYGDRLQELVLYGSWRW